MMLTFEDLGAQYDAFVFELDDVLFPKKDYLLQVYYLFANLLEYTETVPPAGELTNFLKTAYQYHGEEGLFERAAQTFVIDEKYREQFRRMHVHAQLPLRLYLFKDMLTFLQEAVAAGKKIILLTKGNPLEQLNKVKHLDWQGVDQSLKVYFYDELYVQGYHSPVEFALKANDVPLENALLVSKHKEHAYPIMPAGTPVISVDLLLSSDALAEK
ncbi:HAD family hydrolase [Olivibacter sitiensis]|uniref:HAD family hydrolase n=1 Tax=Olivibacter sitiensis TaxID=376470 RepID=UPI0012F9E824|nr:HAD family hydrolase [Olivibacter sitiensis]